MRKIITISLKPDTLAEIDRQAKAAGMTRSGYIAGQFGGRAPLRETLADLTARVEKLEAASAAGWSA